MQFGLTKYKCTIQFFSKKKNIFQNVHLSNTAAPLYKETKKEKKKNIFPHQKCVWFSRKKQQQAYQPGSQEKQISIYKGENTQK